MPKFFPFFFILPTLLIYMAWSFPQGYNPVRFDSNRVAIRSEINDLYSIRVHCRSKREDLGARGLDYGESYDFSVQPDPNSCYWCKLYRWKNENENTVLYKILIDAWGNGECGDAPSNPNQFWSVRDDGVYSENVLKKSWLRPEEAKDF